MFAKSEQACNLSLKRFLYAAILITTKQQRQANAELKTERPAAPDVLMMSVGAIPLSN